MIVETLVGLSLGYLTWSMVAMEINYQRASSMGIPLVRLPVDPLNLAWLVLEPHIWYFLNFLPFNWGSFGRYSRRGWHFKDKAESHLRYGPAWALVTPCDIYVHVADPDAIHDIFVRRADFLRPSKMYKLLEVYGPCISTASWTDWARHRKVLAAPFNESIMKFVWTETLAQATDMLSSWTATTHHVSPSASKDTRTLSLNVLAATGFRRSYKFQSSTQPTGNEEQSYRDALQTVLDNVILLMLAPSWLFKLPLLPQSWKYVANSSAKFKEYMEDMLTEETVMQGMGKPGRGGLMTSFVRALNTHEKQDPKQIASKGLSIDETYGNIFVINFAGHDTTANTLAFSMILLAAHTDVQDWIGEEIQEMLKDSEEGQLDYETLFPKLKRCQAVLLETLRLFPPIMSLPKWSNDQPQLLRVGDQTITIPPKTGFSPSVLAIQTHPKYWKDPLVWQPSRWISLPHTTNEQRDLASRLQQEVVFTPRQSTYFPWSDGPQNCPGAKFAQVEFVAVMSRLFLEHRVGIVQNDNETAEDARKRALAVTQDCDLELLLRMRNADKVSLTWKKI